MEKQHVVAVKVNQSVSEVFPEEDDDDFSSCCGDEEALNVIDEVASTESNDGFNSSTIAGTDDIQDHEICGICYEDKPLAVLQCAHKFCSSCLALYVDGKLRSSQVPAKCPHWNCKTYLSKGECKSFLSLERHEILEKALAEADVNGIYCPYSNCSAPANPHEEDNTCVECSVCRRSFCVKCIVPWHSLVTCEEYQKLPLDERDDADINLHRLAENKRWRRCQQCRRMIELSQGCYHMTCWCGHEFCYSCGAEYRDGHKACECAFWDDDNAEDFGDQSVQESEQFAWGTMNTLSAFIDWNPDNDIPQFAFVQTLVLGVLGAHTGEQPQQSAPESADPFVDAMKDHRLPWLERFVSVIIDIVTMKITFNKWHTLLNFFDDCQN